ncbi:putative uncharacterized protein DDB_G0282133 [Manduca sexta]|uniref:putative uncharacterized protein DDB_G0282133 n=1 Tax=Manduca sexta TaxID=7130 RepID=UPI00188FF23F|nr:putative uncharacterized protein DDB_G0282133 [Manduca sexta]
MLWILFLMIHCVYSRPNDNPAVNTKHCIKMSSAKETEINNILAKFTDFLNKISEEHEDIDIPYINIHIENHSDDESDEKDTKFRVVINDCNDVVDRHDKSNKHVHKDKEDSREVTDKYLKATQDLPNNRTFLEINEELINKIETLKNLLNDCNKFKAGVDEMRENVRNVMASNYNNQFVANITDYVFTNDPREGSSRNVKDNVVTEEKEITVTDKKFENIYKTTQDNVNENNFDIKDVSNNIKLDIEEKGAKDYKDLENGNEITHKVSPYNTHTEINTSARSDQWKVKFMKVIEKVLDDTVSNIQYIADNNNNSYAILENLYIEKSKLNVKLTVDDEEMVSVEHDYNHNNSKNDFEINKDTVETQENYVRNLNNLNQNYNHNKGKNDSEINEDTAETEEKSEKKLNHLNQNDESYANTEMDSYNKTRNNNDKECEYDEDDDFNANMKTTQNNSKDEYIRDLVTDKVENNFAKITENSKIIHIEPNKDKNITVDTYTGNTNKYVNSDTKDTETDNAKLTDIEHGIINDKDYLQIINNADTISMNINNDDNNSHKHDKQEVTDKIVLINQINSKKAYKPEVNASIDYLKDLNTNNNSIDDNREININNQTGNSIIEDNSMDVHKYNDASNEIVEKLMSNLEQKVPELLPLSLEENGEEMLQILEKQGDKSKPLWVYIQEKNNQNEYVFFSKK